MENNKVLLLYVLVVLGVNFSSTDALETTTADYAAGTTDYTSSDTTGEYTTAITTDPPTVVFTTTDPHTTAASADATSMPVTDNTTATVMDTTTTTAMNYTTSTTTTPLITNSTIDVSTTSPATITTTSATTTSTTNSTTNPSTTANTTDPCYSDPCGDNGTCTTLSEYPYYKCDCEPPYTGGNCTQDACYQQACEENGGQCEVISDEPFYTCPCYLPQLGTYFCVKERIFIVAFPLGGLLFLVIVTILIACIVRKRRYRKSARKIDVEEAGAIPLSSMEQTNPSIATNNSENSTTNEKSEDPEKKIGDHEEGVEDVEANAVILLVEEAINTGNDEVSTEPNSLNDNGIEPTATVTSKETGIQNQTASKETPEQDIDKGEEKEKLEKQHKTSIVPTSTTASKESEYPKKDIPTEDMSESDVVNEGNNSLQASPATSKEESDVGTTHEAVQTEAIKSDVLPGKDVEVEGSEKMDASIATLKAEENIVATNVEVKQTSNRDGKIDEEEKGPLQQNTSLTKTDAASTTTSKQEISPPMTIDFELRQKAVVKEEKEEENEEEEEEEEKEEKEDEEEEEGSVKTNAIVTVEDGITDNTSQMNSINETNTEETNSSWQSEPPKFLAEISATDTQEISKANEEGKQYLEANKSPISEGDSTTTIKSNQETTPTKEATDEKLEAIATVLETDEKIAVDDIRRQSNPVTSTDQVTSLTTSISQKTDVDASIDTTATQKAVKIDEEANETHKNELENSPNEVVNSTPSTTTTKSSQAEKPTDDDGVGPNKDEKIDDSHQIVRSRLSSVLRNEVKSAATKLNPITEAAKPDITDEEKKNMQQDADGNWHYQTVRNFWEATTSESHATNSTTKSSGDQTIKEPPAVEDENDRANQALNEH